ncbi:DUF523 domain-containing protein [Leeia oryzae]|uniref:DUF523 domain-containing protein n=1 Tax=Leeia oryzae TaxID=356662 RepID=UPI00037B524B|nr:DUF523 domain-containing protein [Leeia oryzae]
MPGKPHKILVSACLLGQPVRYDGKALSVLDTHLQQWQTEGRVVPVCPELAGGLPVPRPAAEIRHGAGQQVLHGLAKVTTQGDEDVSGAFVQGAHTALELALRHECAVAILTAKSPSCGNAQIYDGTFQRQLRDGQGVTAALLVANGIVVFNQHQLAEVAAYLDGLG